jgi:hypothetical protein
VDRSQETLPALDELRLIRQEARHTRSLNMLRRQFDRLQNVRRLYIDDFNVQVLVADIHQEIVERARYLRGESPASALTPEETYELFPDEPPPTHPPPAHQASSSGAFNDEPEAAEIPPEVPRLDPKTWQIAVGLAVFLTVLVLAAFFYLIQTARKINFKDDSVTATAAPQADSGKPKAAAVSAPAAVSGPPPVAMTPTLRLYTDLVPGAVTFDDQPPRDIDGELVLDNLKPGQHSLKVTGPGGMAAFRFEVTGNAAPRAIGAPLVSNALAVLVSVENGHGRLVTNAEHSNILLDGKDAGQVDAKGLVLPDLGKNEHDLRVVQDKDHQRFVLTYTPAPALTAYIKSDPSIGTLVLTAGQDDVDVYIENVLYRRKTAHGQLRVSLHAGKYNIRVHKDGFPDPPPSTVEIKKAEETELQFHLRPAAPELATLQIKGGLPGMLVSIDNDMQVTVGPDGAAQIANVKTGDHTIELRHDEYTPRKFVGTFHAGETTLLSGSDISLEKVTEQSQTAPAPAAGTEAPKTDKAAAPPAKPETSTLAPAGPPLRSEKVLKGGGFVPYGTPKTPGRYTFQAQGRLGGFLKRGKLQWYAGYQDGQNYVLFVLDGKRITAREVRDGKSLEQRRAAFSVDSDEWVQVDLAVKTDSISVRARTTDGAWSDIVAVTSPGRDFTQDRVGVYVPDKDEVAVANFHFTSH